MKCRTSTDKLKPSLSSPTHANDWLCSVDYSVWDPLSVPCAEWMCEFGHELDPFAGNCLLEGGEGGGDTLSMEFVFEDAEGMENGEGSYSFEFVFDSWSSSPDLNRCSDLICCTGESIFECQLMQHYHTCSAS